MTRVLDEARELSNGEKQQIYDAQQKWYPKLIQSYNTTLYEMMASPLKKAIIHSLVLLVMFIIFFVVLNNLGLEISPIYILVPVVVIIFSAATTYIRQYKENDNLTLMLTITKPGATKYDYESSSVIQSKLFRDTMARSGRSTGSSFAGSLLGSGIGSALGSGMKFKKRR